MSTAASAAPPAVPPASSDRQLRTTAWLGWLLLVLVGCALRLVNLSAPIAGDHVFRQSQTAWTAREFVRTGISLTHAPVPVLGPPWDVPFEMPLYQAMATTLARAGGLSVETACRVVSVGFFYASVAALFVLARVLFASTAVAAAAVLVFVWSPVSLVWSRATLMETMAVFFALAYVLAMVLALRGGGAAAAWAAAAMACGSLGGLVKVTTMAVTVPPVLTAIGLYWLHARRAGPPSAELRRNWLLHVGVLLGMAVPLAVSEAWVHHADAIKAQSPMTAWLTSARLTAWNYGTLAQRAVPGNWAAIGWRVVLDLLPGLAAALPLVGLFVGSRASRTWTAATLAGALLPVVVFFNLYVQHSYYLTAVTPMAALAAGAGLAAACGKRPARWLGALAVLALGLGLSWQQTYFLMTDVYPNPVQAYLARDLRELTTPDQYVLVEGLTWDPETLYYADRRGLMWYARPDGATPEQLRAKVLEMGTDRFGAIVYLDKSNLGDLFPNARPVRQVGPFTVALPR